MNETSGIFADISLPLARADKEAARKQEAARVLNVPVSRIKSLRVKKQSIDARRRHNIHIQLRLEVGLDEELPPEALPVRSYPTVRENAPEIIIVGFGPAGMFAALRCLELGLKPVVLERGKNVSERRFDLAPIMRQGVVIEDSNYCFGEGGAGTFSDGKLYTRATKRGPVQEIFETLVAHGAPAEILTEAHPHIGSNLLPNVVKAIRCSVLAAGGEIHFRAKMNGLVLDASQKKLLGVVTEDGREFRGRGVILATGHSARDVYGLLHRQGIRMERKPFAVGVRIEHSQQFIDAKQYHLSSGQKRPDALPAARYSLATKVENRGVHSFCMCPGGFIVPAATENDEVVVNGMSLSRRDSPFANAGFVVTVEPEDTLSFEREHGILSGIAFQKDLEIKASQTGGGKQKAPGQRVIDFLDGRISTTLPETSYHPGGTSAPLHEILPSFIVSRMRTGLREFEQKMRGYVTNDALLLGFETRTSSPLRIPRHPETLQHLDIQGLFPAGEGAGYAGGIASAAIDGRRCADAAAASLDFLG